MKPALKKTFSAIAIALASLIIVIGIASLAMIQDGISFLPGHDKSTATPSLSPTLQNSGPNGSTDQNKPTSSTGTEATSTPTAEQIETPSGALFCESPDGWMPIIVMPDQTIENLAAQYKTTVELLQQGNCLAVKKVDAGTIIFVPASVTQSNTSNARCGAPAGWVLYTVQPGNTLTGIATMFGTSVNQLMVANCLTSSYVYAGQTLWVPPYYAYPAQPIWTPEPTWITFPMLMTPQTPMLPTGIPYPIFPPTP